MVVGEVKVPVERATYSRGEIGVLLDCSLSQVDRLTKLNQIPGSFKIGRLVRFKRAAVDAWLAAGAHVES